MKLWLKVVAVLIIMATIVVYGWVMFLTYALLLCLTLSSNKPRKKAKIIHFKRRHKK